MEFFNKKEEVINIELTSYGKRLLADGKFKPVYYSFFDDDILYDGEYGGVSEPQNDVQTRINEGISQKAQANFSGVESTISQAIVEARTLNPRLTMGDFITIQNVEERNFTFTNYLGTASPLSEYAPSWSVDVLANSLTSSNANLTGALDSLKIPQLNITIDYTIKKIENINEWDLESLEDYKLLFQYGDDSALMLKKSDIVLDVFENNRYFSNKNFEIEVYEITSSVTEGECHYPDSQYYFPRDKVGSGNLNTLDSTFAEYFLDIFVDEEIDQDLLCKLKPKDPAKGRFIKSTDCVELPLGRLTNENVYSIPMTSEDQEEPCD